MMTDRKKLVAVLNEIEDEHGFICDSCIEAKKSFCIENFADHLIDNGVTVNEWISVEDRLPEINEAVLMKFTHNMVVGYLYDVDEGCTSWRANTDDEWEADCDFEPSHWMPLPEPPKEE